MVFDSCYMSLNDSIFLMALILSKIQIAGLWILGFGFWSLFLCFGPDMGLYMLTFDIRRIFLFDLFTIKKSEIQGERMSGKCCVVTGGRGFAARHLVDMLIRSDKFLVRIADLPPAIDLSPEEENGDLGRALESGRASYVSMDLRNKPQVLQALKGAEVVFHMAAPHSGINNYQLHYSVNVEGTKNVIDACVELKVKILIFTSSASVVFDGIHPIFNGDEALPYPPKPLDSYSATKAEAEAAVLKANGTNGLLTCSLRPSSIFGPGDKLFIPSLAESARAGKSKFLIGDGNNVYDFTYVENVAHAHICAEQTLSSSGEAAEKAAGQAYFITNMEPIKFWEFTGNVCAGLGYERPRIKVPAVAVLPVAHAIQWAYNLLGTYGMKLPDGLKRTIESFSHLNAENQPKRDGPSKASLYLGNGRVADTLLWKDTKKTLIVLLVLMGIYYSFISSNSTIITATSKLLLMAAIFLFVHGRLPEKMYVPYLFLSVQSYVDFRATISVQLPLI
ncbi:unnamed protein product [Linum tenue]|uniref:Uncharacterized protein n=1 Tax=Linum tenue TaxID=586396 RepID=A0AAV0PH88_9ROSI|nr:unnamed protein product [Linum tenue]